MVAVMVELWLWFVVVMVVVVRAVCFVVFVLELRYFLATLSYEPIRLWNDGLQLQDRGGISIGNCAKYEITAYSHRYCD